MNRVLLAVIGVLFLACAACSASEGSESSNGSGSNGNGANGAGGNPSGSGTGTGGLSPIGSGGSGATGGLDACASSEYKAKPLPLDMHIMLDQSGSMEGELWAAVTAAIKGFVSNSPATDGIGVGLQYFPLITAADPCAVCVDSACCSSCGASSITCINGVCSCSGGGVSCSAADYATPEVAIQTLPGVKTAIEQSLDAHQPNGGTPTRPALEGALQHAQAWKAMPANADHKVIVVLATDGEPSGCDQNDIGDVVAVAQSGLPDILTFVIGVGSELVALNQVAAAGGTGQALMVDTGGNVEQQFVDAMNAIQDEAAIQCEFLIPEPEGNEQLDFDEVNVVFTPSGQGPTTILYVGDASQCDPQSGGWYYDDPSAPSKILVCPQTCDALEGDAAPEVDILLGCQTETPK